MPLDVEVPEPPTLHGPQDPGDYDAVEEAEDRIGDQTARETLATALEAGAWADAFEDWRRDTYLAEDQYRAVIDLELIDQFDFYWNPSAEDVGYRAPTVPEDRPAPYDEHLDRSDVADVDEALDDLGRTVSEVLENDYVDPSEEDLGFYGDQ